MNILFIFMAPIVPYEGGVQRVTDTLSRELGGRGHKSVYLTYAYKQHISSPDIRCPQLYVELQGRSDDEVRADLQKIVDDYNITHVVNQICSDAAIRIVRLLPNPLRTKVVFTYHVIPFVYMPYTRKQMLGLPTANYRQKLFKIASIISPRIYKSFFCRLEKKSLRQGLSLATKFCFISDKFYGNVLKYLPEAPSGKFEFVNNPNSYSPQADIPTYQEREKAVVWVGRLENSQKNIFGFLKMWQQFSSRHPEWKAYVVGDGSSMPKAKAFVAKHRLQNVCFEGNQRNVMPYYKKCRFLALTSFGESWGMILTEAMTCGCIPVAMNTFATLSDIIDDRQNGLICKPDEKNMANRLTDAASDDAFCQQMSTAAVEKAQKFDASVIAGQWEKLLENL